jgi:hypothetical protein
MEKLLKQFKKEDGHLYVSLKKPDGTIVEEKVAELVAKSFVDNPNNFTNIRHIDGNKENNIATNIEWCL